MKITIERSKDDTTTKKWLSRLLCCSCVWITLSYVLAFFGHEQIAESLSETVATVIIATILGYLCKSFFETREEERLKYQRELNKKSAKAEDGGIYEDSNISD